MLKGLFFAVAANALWATAFVAPLLLPEFTPVEITVGRYAVFGLSSFIILAVIALRRGTTWRQSILRSPRAWIVALVLTALGNVIYYACLSTGLRLTGTAMPTLIVGLLPMAMAIFGALGERGLPWGGFAVSIGLIGSGLALSQLGGAHGDTEFLASGAAYGTGLAFAVAALISWTVYGLTNAHYLQRRNDTDMMVWTCMIGVSTWPRLLPLVAISEWGGAMEPFLSHSSGNLPRFALVVTVLGVGTSWIATWACNEASALLPTRLLGQIIVVETIMALVFAALLRWEWPAPTVIIGAGLLLGGVLLGIRQARRTAQQFDNGRCKDPKQMHR